jgi:glycerol-3-phosphate O-acyltransferase / dihydroxyacetone phosphate acyltransferase
MRRSRSARELIDYTLRAINLSNSAMWLLPALSRLSNTVVRVYYRFRVGGATIPAQGAALLVANHPNSLLDPAVVAAAAGRPVRFLAKAPLFSDRLIGWLIRASGSIPVYRAVDDPAAMRSNLQMFRAARAALGEGAAIGIFPEGTSHSEPSLVPLRTGAARLALGAAAEMGRALPIIPIGLSFPEKGVFRTDALAIVGAPIDWDDLAGRAENDSEAVRELTSRIDHALREVTFNVSCWEDAALVDTAEAVYAAVYGSDPDPVRRFARLRGVSEALDRLRGSTDTSWQRLARRVSRHARMLRWLDLTPADLNSKPNWTLAAGWTLRQLSLLAVALPIAVVGMILFSLPYFLTGSIEARARPLDDVRSTFKALVGSALFIVWIAALALAAGWLGGWVAAVTALVVLPATALITLGVIERWNSAQRDASRFFRLRRRKLIRPLRLEQEQLAAELDALWRVVGTV